MEEHVYAAEPALAQEDEAADEVMRGLRARAKAEGLWAPHLPPEAGGTGGGFLAYADLNEEIGRSVWAQLVFNCQAPDAGNGEILHLFGTDEQKSTFLRPLVEGETRSFFSMTEPEVSGADPTGLRTTRRARRRRVGDRRSQVVLVGGRGRRVRDRHGGHRSGRGAAPADVADPRSGRRAGAADRARSGLRSPRPRLVDALRGLVLRRACARLEPARRARRRLPDRPEAARPGSHPPRDALARPDAARVRADVLATRSSARRSAGGSPTSRRSRTGSPTPPPRSRRAGS